MLGITTNHLFLGLKIVDKPTIKNLCFQLFFNLVVVICAGYVAIN